MTVRGSFEATSGTTVTLELSGGTTLAPDYALVAIHWSASDIQTATLKTRITPKKTGSSYMVWDSLQVNGTKEIEVDFTLTTSVSTTGIRAVVVDLKSHELSAVRKEIP